MSYPQADRPTATLVLVHGLWHDERAWDAVRLGLEKRGLPSAAVHLPLTDLAADVAATRAVLDEVGGPVVLVGHSYGGAVITGAGDHPTVAQLVYFAGFALTESESIGRTLPELAIPPTALGEALRFSADGSEVAIDPERARELLYPDVPPAVADAAIARLRPVGRGLFSARPPAVAWRSKPATYVVSTQDLVVHPDLQRAMAARATRMQSWECGHSSLASRPDAVAELLAELASVPSPAPEIRPE